MTREDRFACAALEETLGSKRHVCARKAGNVCLFTFGRARSASEEREARLRRIQTNRLNSGPTYLLIRASRVIAYPRASSELSIIRSGERLCQVPAIVHHRPRRRIVPRPLSLLLSLSLPLIHSKNTCSLSEFSQQ